MVKLSMEGCRPSVWEPVWWGSRQAPGTLEDKDGGRACVSHQVPGLGDLIWEDTFLCTSVIWKHTADLWGI